jgi:hypothetical protein
MKPPVSNPVPTPITQAPDMITLPDDGLERVHVASVGRNPVPVTEIRDPMRPLTGVKEITGAEWTIVNAAFPVKANNTPMKSRATTTLK